MREGNGSSWGRAIDVESEESFNRAKVSDGIGFGELTFEVVDPFDCVGDDKEVVDVYSDYCDVITVSANKDGFVGV